MNRKLARQKAEALVAQMTVAEAAAQLKYDAPAIPRLGVPAYNWWNEALHGVARSGMATMFPQAIGIGATFDPELTKKLGDVAATEGRAKYNAVSSHGDRDIYKGLTYWSPNVNIFRDPRWGPRARDLRRGPVPHQRDRLRLCARFAGRGRYAQGLRLRQALRRALRPGGAAPPL